MRSSISTDLAFIGAGRPNLSLLPDTVEPAKTAVAGDDRAHAVTAHERCDVSVGEEIAANLTLGGELGQDLARSFVPGLVGVGGVDEDVGVDRDAHGFSRSRCSSSSTRPSASLSSRSIFGLLMCLLISAAARRVRRCAPTAAAAVGA